MNRDSNGNPDVMGSRPMTPAQAASADELRLAFNSVHAMIDVLASDLPPAEAARLFATAKTHLEIAGLLAVKGVSRK